VILKINIYSFYKQLKVMVFAKKVQCISYKVEPIFKYNL